MPQTNSITNPNKKYTHSTETERELIEQWYKTEDKTQAEIARLLNRDPSTISREIKRGQAK